MKARLTSLIFITVALFFQYCKVKTNKATVNSIKVDSININSDSAFIAKIRTFGLITNQEKRVGTLDYIIKDIPTADKPYYIIQVGKTNKYRLEIFYNFYCYPKTRTIKLYDIQTDKLTDVN